MKKKAAAWIVLGVITLAAGLALALTNQVTKDIIVRQEEEAVIAARKEVLPGAEAFEKVEGAEIEPLTELYAGKVGDQVQGYVGTVIAKGYGGPVQVIAGIDPEGKITGVSVGGSDFAETAGLGAKAKDKAFTEQFKGKLAPVKLVKSPADRGDNTVDAITAATITSRAVSNAVEDVYNAVEGLIGSEDVTDVASQVTWPQTVTASSKGYGGPVAVSITVNEDKTISAITIGDEDFAETEGLGTGVLEEAFYSQFIGKAVPVDAGDIDVIGGATVSSEAVIKAVNKAAEKLQEGASAMPQVTWPQTVTASSKGYGGPVAVSITVNEDKTISAITIGDEDFAETEGLGTGVLEEAFYSQFIGKAVPVDAGDIDVIGGATVSSEAVIKAVNKAAEKLQEGASAAPQVTWPQTVTASSKGYGGPVAVSITVNEDKTISAITVGDEDFAETEGLGTGVLEEAFYSQFIGKAVPVDMKDVDGVSGATVSTEAVVKAINKAAEKLQEGASAAPAPASVTWPQTVTASAKGYGGPVAVTLVVNEDGTIVEITIGDADFAETEGLGTQVQDEAFYSQFIGKAVPVDMKDVDGVSGATVSTEAVVKAINKAADKLQK